MTPTPNALSAPGQGVFAEWVARAQADPRMLLADATMSPDFTAGLMALVVVVTSILTVVYTRRATERTPPFPEEAHRSFATRSEVETVSKKLDTEIARVAHEACKHADNISARIEERLGKIEVRLEDGANQFTSIGRALGRLEGRSEEAAATMQEAVRALTEAQSAFSRATKRD